ncbi:PAXB1 protein, partial [Polypterus senegalus]
MRRSLSRIDWDKLLNVETVEEQWNRFKNVLHVMQDRYIPKFGSNRKLKKTPRWISKDLKKKLQRKKLLYKAYKTNDCKENHSAYEKMRATIKKDIREAKRQLERNIADKAKEDPKRFFQYFSSKRTVNEEVKFIRNSKGELKDTDNEIADALNLHFSEVFTSEQVDNLPEVNATTKEHYSGLEEAIFRNIHACKELSQTTRTAYGPNGMNKLVINQLEKLFVTNDAATILRELEVIEGYEIACRKTLEILPDCACASAKNLRNTEEAASYIRTAVMSKQYGNEDFLSHLIAQACVSVYPESGHFNVDSVRVCKILGSGISSSSVLHGMVFKRETEGDVTSVKNAKLAIFSCPFDCMVTETKGTVLINNAEELLSYSKGEENMMESQVKAIADAGANIVVTGGKVADMALHYANKYQLMVVRLNSKWDLRRLCKTVGASALPRLTPPTPEEMGYCDSVYLTEVGDTQVVVFKHDTQDCKISTLVIRGSTDNLMDDIERAVDDGVNTFKVLVRSCPGLEQYAIKKFAEAFEAVPRALAENSGVKSNELISKLYAVHQEGNKNIGFDIENEGAAVKDMLESGIFDPYLVKHWGIKLATNAAVTVLGVDQVLGKLEERIQENSVKLSTLADQLEHLKETFTNRIDKAEHLAASAEERAVNVSSECKKLGEKLGDRLAALEDGSRRMMSELQEEIKQTVLSVIPGLPEERLNQLVEKLIGLGVESFEDLVYVKEEDILEFIQPIQCRKLLNAWKHHEQKSSILAQQFVQASSPQHSPQTSSSGSSVSSMGYSASSTSVSPVFVTWPETFQIPWDSMPTGIQMAIANCQRPSPADRRQMIRVLADEIRKHESNPTRSQCLIVVRQIVKQYPKSFADMIGDKQIAGGYASLLSQLKVRIEHLNRSNTLSHRIQSNESGTIKKRSTKDSYGCTRWEPELPAGESYDSLEVKRQRMEEIFLYEGSTGADRGEVCKLMEETYCYQRRMINAIPSPIIASLKTKWPYLFMQRYMNSHFELLTDRNVLSHLEMSFKECGKLITEYFKAKPTNAIVQNVLTRGEEDVAACVLQLLLAHFEEKMDGLILQTDAFATSADIHGTLNLPGSPRLIILEQVQVESTLISAERGEEEMEVDSNDESDYQSSAGGFSNALSSLSTLRPGEIPDAAFIHAARKRRQLARELGDSVPNDTESGKKHISQEDENDVSDDDDDEEKRRIIFTVKEKTQRQKIAEEIGIEGSDDEALDAGIQDEELNRWEQEQIRKGISIPQVQTNHQADSNLYYQNVYEATAYGSSYGISYSYGSYGAEDPKLLKPESTGSYTSCSNSMTPISMDLLKKRLKDRYESMKEVHSKNQKQYEQNQQQLESSTSLIERLEGSSDGIADQYKFLQEMQGYVRDLLECFSEKVPLILDLESAMHHLLKRRASRLVQRRQDDIKDESSEFASHSSKTVVAPSLDSFGRDRKAYLENAKQRRIAEREARRTRRRQSREQNGKRAEHHEGLSSDDEETSTDTTSFNLEKERIFQDSKKLFEDVLEDFYSIDCIKSRFEIWRKIYYRCYQDAYIGLCLPKLFNPLVRLQLIPWTPLEANCPDFESMIWFESLLFYGCDEEEETQKGDVDVHLLPSIAERVIIPKLAVLIDEVWDPMSTSQSARLVSFVQKLINGYPSVLNGENKSTQELLKTIVMRTRRTLDDDIFMPLYPKQDHIKTVIKLLASMHAVDHVITVASEHAIKDVKAFLENK